MMHKRRKNLLLLATSNGIGGTERVVCGLARELKNRQWQVRAVFPEWPESPKLLPWCQEQNVQAEQSPALLDIASEHSWRDMLALSRFVRAAKPDIVHLHYACNFISLKDVLAVRLAGLRPYVTLHQAVPWSDLSEQQKKMTALSARLCQKLVAICGPTHDLLREAGIAESRIATLYCGVRPPSHYPKPSEARARLRLPENAFVVASMANLSRRKGLHDLVAAAVQIADPNLHLMVAGEGEERASLEVQAAPLGACVHFPGRISGDTSDVYAACDVFALPSYAEGLPLVYLEAAFHGVPSIATPVGGSPEAVIDGETGLLVPTANPSALAEAIIRLRNNAPLRHQLGEAARARAQAEFTEAAMADRYAALYA